MAPTTRSQRTRVREQERITSSQSSQRPESRQRIRDGAREARMQFSMPPRYPFEEAIRRSQLRMAAQRCNDIPVSTGEQENPPQETAVDEHVNVKKVYRSLREEYIDRVKNVPKDRLNYGRAPAICYSSLGNSHNLAARPLGRLPRHIVDTLNSHYIQLSHGLMVPGADLFNNDDQPIEELFPAIIDEVEFGRLIREVAENENKAKTRREQSGTDQAPVEQKPVDIAQQMTHGEIIGKYVIYGAGVVTRAVCCKTKETFTAHILDDWKVTRVLRVMQRLQIPKNFTSTTADERRLSELCVSNRTEIIKSLSRYILFLPSETNTLHSYASDRLDRMTEKEAMTIFKKIVELVRFCHSRNVLMRNFKTRNFYITKDANGEFIIRPAFLLDMWCEEDTEDGPHSRRAVCVPFMAPEMLTTEPGTPLHSRTTEMWGLGVLLYILLTGKYPFHETDMRKLFRAIRLRRHRFPPLFVTRHSKNLVNLLLRKRVQRRLELPELWQRLERDFPDIRCRSNLVMKQRDLILKRKMFTMYWNTYKDRLLPQNVLPIKEELQSCRDDLPLMTKMARNDMKGIQESIRRHAKKHLTQYQAKVMQARLDQINRLLAEKESVRAAEAGEAPKNVRATVNNVSWELLLPRCLYPINSHYHPSHKPRDWNVYQTLRAANQLKFPPVKKNNKIKRYPAPKFKGLKATTSVSQQTQT